VEKLTKLADPQNTIGYPLDPWSRIGWQGKKDEESCGEHADEDGVGQKQLQDLCYTKETANGESQSMNKTKMAHHTKSLFLMIL
jgi:hypothetical protein